MTGSGTLILANQGNDFTGAISISAGTLQVGDGSTSNASIGTGAITNNGQLILDQIENHTLANVISGTGSLEQRGTGILTVSGSNTYSGVTLISQGTLVAGSSTALGTTAAGTTILPSTPNGATLDINNQNLGAEAITVQGTGVNGLGAIVNNNTGSSTTPQQALRFVTLTGDTTFGGTAPQSGTNSNYPGVANSGRWDIRGSTSSTASLSTGGNPYNLTKVGNNQVSFVGITVDPALANVDIQEGVLDLEAATNGLGNPAKNVTVESGGILNFYNYSSGLNKQVHLNGGMLYAQSNSLATDNTISGPVFVTDAGGTLNTGGARDDYPTTVATTVMTINGAIQHDTGGTSAAIVTKLGPGTAILNGANTFTGTMNLNDGTLVINNSWAGPVTMASSSAAVTTLAGTGTISGMVTDNYNTNIAPGATANSGSVGTLNLNGGLTIGGDGSGKITIDLSSNPSSGNDLINVNGPLTTYGATNLAVNIIGGYLQGSTGGTHYPLIHYSSAPSGWTDGSSIGTPNITTRQTYSVVNDAATHTIDLVVYGSVANLTWVGGVNSNAWDVKTTANWSGALRFVLL